MGHGVASSARYGLAWQRSAVEVGHVALRIVLVGLSVETPVVASATTGVLRLDKYAAK